MMWVKGEVLMKVLKEDMEEMGILVIEFNSWVSKVMLDIIGIVGLGWKFDVVEKWKDFFVGIYEEFFDFD